MLGSKFWKNLIVFFSLFDEQGWEFFPNRVAPHQSMIIDVQKHDYSRFKDLWGDPVHRSQKRERIAWLCPLDEYNQRIH